MESFSRKSFLGVKTFPITQNYKFDKLLGYGAYGEVKLAQHINTRLYVAIKKMKVDKKDKDLLAMIINEISVLV